MGAWLSVVGIGEDGLAGLGEDARQTIAEASLVIGGPRHLGMLPQIPGQDRLAWASPFAGAKEMVLARRGMPVCVLASGDPMLFGMGASLSRHLQQGEMRVLPAPSSFSLAAARLGWALQHTATLTVHGRPLALVQPHVFPGARLLILSENGGTPAQLAALLRQRGFGPSPLTVLEHMGGPREKRLDGNAADWPHASCADLNVVAVECRAEAGAVAYSSLAGLPDEAFRHDGQLTKRDVRALTLARLAPLPGQLLWDVGAGCGSVGIEWMRGHSACRAIAIEADPARRDLIEHNRITLGVPGLRLVAGSAPAALAGLEVPDAVFIGGGLSGAEVVEECWRALKPGGRLVANAVTLQGEAILTGLHAGLGGELTRIAVAHAQSLGRFDGWRAAMPVTVFSTVKPSA